MERKYTCWIVESGETGCKVEVLFIHTKLPSGALRWELGLTKYNFNLYRNHCEWIARLI